ncbi:hypothetical protein [Jiella avicenniae]|uniref:Uncharacterized protein n=1 Tax=Jiella avicenniae TaxID=2907202 RepID=A0A9X1P0T2_9HYPH|nr:hypothetical protein [Jiella avicenniae]MCE7028433.1 hypothetical protein [Jiella avicenniae]
MSEKTKPLAITLRYTNWRGETADRTIIPERVWFGHTEWHPQDQWMLNALDVEKDTYRDFALSGFAAASLDQPARVKPLDRAPSDQSSQGWTLPITMLEDVAGVVAQQNWERPTIEVVEIIILEAERRILACLQQDSEGAIESNCCIEDFSEPCGPFASMQRDYEDALARLDRAEKALMAAREIVSDRGDHAAQDVLAEIDAALASKGAIR